MTLELNQGVYTVRNQQTPVSVFVLRLQHDCWVVGTTLKRQFTLDDLVKEVTSQPKLRHWLEDHMPIGVGVIYTNCTFFDEDKYVKMNMYRYGIEAVRGGTYSSANIDMAMRVLIMTEFQLIREREARQQNKPMSKTTPIFNAHAAPNHGNESSSSSWWYGLYLDGWDVATRTWNELWPMVKK